MRTLCSAQARRTRRFAGAPRRSRVTVFVATVATTLLVLTGCGSRKPASPVDSGVTGLVHLGPQCPVQIANKPCPDKPAAHARVTVHRTVPGEPGSAGTVVAHGTTAADGTFRIAVSPGRYVVTADAGMSCDLTPAQVARAAYAEVDIACDTGIR